ncbi:ribonuclease H-like domain-containing protein, partial [Tanacetum coccineum]
MDNPNITMEEYIRLQEEKALNRGQTFNWQTATYGKMEYCEDENDCFKNFETKFPAIVLDNTLTSDAAISCGPTVSPLNDNEIDFRISFDESDDEDYTVVYDENSFSYEINYVNNLKTDSENDNDKVNMASFPSPELEVGYFNDLDFFKDFENEFPAIVYNDALTSKSDFLTEHIISPQHIDEFNNETSFPECDEKEQNVLYFNDLFPSNVIYPDDLKSDTDNDNDKIDIEQPSGDMSVIPSPNVINVDTQGSNKVYIRRILRRNLKIQKMNIKFRGGLLGLKRLHGFLEVTAAQCCWWKDYDCLKTFYCQEDKDAFGINKWYQSLALRNFDLEDMELESTNSGPTAKLPILKLGEYEMCAMRIKQYFQIQDYALWEVIENGDSWVPISQTTEENGITTSKVSTPATAEEKIKRKNDVKARGLLLMAHPNEHQLTFSQYPDAKSMFAAIETRFGGNAATKKSQKTLLKQQYENFSATSAESLDSILNRLQKIVSRLAILGVIIAQEDLNLKFLSNLPPEWNTHVVVWMNKPEIETMSIDYLYNNFKIVEQKIKKTVGTSSGGQNLAFMTASSSSSINDANTAYSQVCAISPSVNTVSPQDLEQIHEDDLEAMDLKWQLSLLSVECYNCHKLGHFARECRASRSKEDQFINQDNTKKQGNKEDTSKAMLAINGVGFDWSEMAEEQVQSNMALMAFSDSKVYTDKTCSKVCLNNYETLKKQYDDLLAKQLQTKFELATYKRGLDTIEAQLVTYRKNEVLFSEEVDVLKRDVEFKQYEINKLKAEFERLKQAKDAIDFKSKKFDKASKDLDQLLGSQITNKSKKGFGYCAAPPPHPLIYNRPNKLDLSYYGLDEFKEPEFKGYGPENCKKESNIVKESDNSEENSDKSLVKELESQVKSGFVQGCECHTNDEEQDESITKPEKKTCTPTAAKIEKPVRKSVREVVLTIKRNRWHRIVNTARSYRTHVNTVRPRVINTARQNRTSVNAATANGFNVVMPSACWVWRPIKPNSASITLNKYNYINARGRSKSVMAWFDGGYVAFRGGAYGGKITGKGTLKTANLDFEDLLDENQILLKVPRKDNMYSFDMKNIVPKESLTCLVVKATLDESMLWHRRLGHINFKNINKLVKDNLVRGLPTK